MTVSLTPDRDQMQTMLTAIIEPCRPFEIRVLKVRKDGAEDRYTKALTGFFTDPATAVAHAGRFTGKDCAGVYVTLNPLRDHVTSWGADRIAKGRATSDSDVARHRHLYIDLDPVRPPETNATTGERERARDRARQIHSYLADEGWPHPVWAGGSGSGSLMLYRVDLEPGAGPLIQRVLQGISDLFGDEVVSIDTSVHNPARIVRLAGTVNAKAITPTPDRPWALATGRAVPDAGIVTRAQLEAIAAAEPDPTRREPFTGDRYDLRAILEDSRIQFRVKPRDYGTVYEIADCLTSADHEDGAAFIQFHGGAVAYSCRHDRCGGKGWRDVKQLLNLPAPPTATTATLRVGGEVPGQSRPAPAALRLQTRRASEIAPKHINWIWPGWLPAGMIGLLAGYGGSGKTTASLSIAAACSNGGTLPDGQIAPLMSTLILAAEDSPAHTLIPRLMVLGADLERIQIVEGVARTDDDPGWVQLKLHVALIERAVREHGIGLVIIDPVSSYIGDANGDKESDVRSALMPIVAMAERTGCAVLLIRHVSKAGDGQRAASRILGSTAWHDIPRVAWMLADAPDDRQPERREDGTRDTVRVLGVVKSNLAAKPQARMCIQPADGPLRWMPDGSDVTIDECFFSQSDRGNKLQNAEEWLADQLQGGSVESARLFADANQRGFTKATLRRALKHLHAESFQIPGRKHGGHYWRLPNGAPISCSSDEQEIGAPPNEQVIKRPSQASLAHDEQVIKRPSDQGNQGLSNGVRPVAARRGQLISLSLDHTPAREQEIEIAAEPLEPTGTTGDSDEWIF